MQAFEALDALTPFASVYRYEDVGASVTIHRRDARTTVRELRIWIEEQIRG